MIASITNNITLKKKDGNEVKIAQDLRMNTENEHLLSLKGTFPTTIKEEDGSERVMLDSKSIFDVDRKEDGKYSIVINDTSILKGKDGKDLATLLGINTDAENKTATLNITAPPSTLTIAKKHEEICFKIVAESGKQYVITSNATTIRVKTEGEEFKYSATGDTAISVEMHPDIIDEFFDKDKKFCKTFDQTTFTNQKKKKDLHPEDTSIKEPDGLTDMPKAINNFPTKILSLYGATMKGNSHVMFGASSEANGYTLTSIDPLADKEGRADAQPYIFVTKNTEGTSASPAKQDNYLLINGKMQKCDNFYLQYEQEGEIKKPQLVLEVRPQNSKTGSVKYYSIDLNYDNKKNQLSEESIKTLNLLGDVGNFVDTAADESQIVNILSSDGKNQIKFAKKDDRDYAKDYSYSLKSDNYTLVSDEPNDEDETVGGDDLGPEEPERNDTGDTDEPEKGKKKEAPAPIMKHKKGFNYEKQVEAFAGAIEILAFFLGIGSILTGGIALLIAGLVLGGIGITGQTFASKFVAEERDIALKRLEEYEQQQSEDEKFEENFMANEAALDNAMGLAEEKESGLAEMLADENSPAHKLANAFDEYGVGFERLPEGMTRTNALSSINGYQAKTKMLSSLEQITSAHDIATRNQMIAQFMNTNFAPMPEEKKTELTTALFGPEKADANTISSKNEALKPFITSLRETVVYEEREKQLLDKQRDSLSSARDSSILRTIGSKSFDKAKREKFFNRYSDVLVRKMSTDKSLNEAKINNLLNKIPENERAFAIDKLALSSKNIEDTLALVEKTANENRTKVNTLQDAMVYVKALNNLKNKPNEYVSFTKTQDDLVKLLDARTLTYRQNSLIEDKYKFLETIENNLTNSADNNGKKNVLHALHSLTGTYSSNDTHNDTSKILAQIQQNHQEIRNLLISHFSEELTDISCLYDSSTVLPNSKKLNQVGNEGNYIEIASKYISEKDPKTNELTLRAKRLKGLIDDYNKNSKEYLNNRYNANDFNSLQAYLKSEVKDQLKDVENANEYLDNIVSEKAIEDKVKSFKSSYAKAYINEDTKKEIAKAMLYAEAGLKNKNISNVDKAIFENSISTLNLVLTGKLLQANIDKAVVSSLGDELANKNREDAIKLLNKTSQDFTNSAKGYKKLYNLVSDLNLSNDAKKEIKFQTGDKNIAEKASNIINEDLKDKKADENGLTYGDILEKSLFNMEILEKEINNMQFLTGAEQRNIIGDIRNMKNTPELKHNPAARKSNLEFCFSRRIDPKTYKEHKKELDALIKLAGTYAEVSIAKDLINNEIKNVNERSKAVLESSCEDVLGKEYANSEYRRLQVTNDKNKNDEKTFDNVYKLMVELAPGEDKEKVEADLKKLVQENPDMKASKIAKKFGIDKDALDKGLKQVKNKGIDENTQKSVWLKEKEVNDSLIVVEEFKEAWKQALSGDTKKLETFIENSKSNKELEKQQKKADEQKLKNLKGDELKKAKAEIEEAKKAEPKKNKKEIEKQDEKAIDYAELLDNIGLPAEDIEKVLNGEKRFVIDGLKKLDNLSPALRAEKLLAAKNDELDEIKLQSSLLTDADRKIAKACKNLEKSNKDVQEYKAKVELIKKLEKSGVPEKVVDEIYTAFANGDKKYFDKTKIGDKTINELLAGYEFDVTDTALLKRLGIDPKDIKNGKTRNRTLKDAEMQIQIQNISNQIKVNFAQDNATKTDVQHEGDLSKEKPQEAKEGLGFFKKLIDIFKDKSDKAIAEQKEIDKQVEEAHANEHTEEKDYESKPVKEVDDREAEVE